jgi:hypothetical protein
VGRLYRVVLHLLHAIFRRCDFANAAIAASRVGS